MGKAAPRGSTNRIPSSEANRIKENLFGGLGLPFRRIANSFYVVQGGRVNVKITTPRPSGQYWFNIQRRADSYLWICWKPTVQKLDAYYWVPARVMMKLITRGAYRDWTWEQRGRRIPNFMIDTQKDTYVVGTGGISIGEFRGLNRPP